MYLLSQNLLLSITHHRVSQPLLCYTPPIFFSRIRYAIIVFVFPFEFSFIHISSSLLKEGPTGTTHPNICLFPYLYFAPHIC